jgi:curved DNA-binding protein CbpA
MAWTSSSVLSPCRILIQTTAILHPLSPLSVIPYSCKFHDTSIRRSSKDDIRWPQASNPTPYEIFGLPPTASPEEIKKRYYELAKKYHPDSRASSMKVEQERLQRFRQVVQANELLSAAQSRRIYDDQGYGWGDMNVNDIMGDPAHWRGNYEGRFRASRNPYRPNNFDEGATYAVKAQPYYTSNANFAGGIIVLMVLAGVLQLSHVNKNTQKTFERNRIVHEQASLNLRDARGNAKSSGRRDMIEAFQQRRDVNPRVYSDEELESLGISGRKQ